MIMRFDGSAWRFFGVPDPAAVLSFYGVWAAGPSDVWVVGHSALRWNGTAFSRWDVGFGGILRSVWGASASDVWTVAVFGRVSRFNGVYWLPITSGTSQHLWGVHGTSSSDVWIVGEGGTILHWDGAAWTSVPTNTAAAFWSVQAPSASEVLVSGNSGAIWRFDGTSWQRQPLLFTLQSLNGIDVSATGKVWVVGSNDVLARRSAGAWEPFFSVPVGGNVHSVWAAGADEVFMSGDGYVFREGPDGGRDSFVSGASMWDLHGSSASDVWGVGNAGRVARWDGTPWSLVDAGTTQALSAVHSFSPNDVHAVGGTRLHFDGTSWTEHPVAIGSVSAVWGAAPNDVWAVGGPRIYRWDGSAWTDVASPTNHMLVDIWGTATNDVYFAASSGHIYRWNGSSIALYTFAPSAPISNLWGNSGNDLYVANNDGTVMHFDGAAWTTEFIWSSQSLAGIHGAGGRVWVVGAGSTVLVKN